MNFANKLKNTLNNDFNISVTENGALGYKTTGKNILDLNFAVASLRNATDKEIINMFIKAYFEDKKTALVWLFYARDIRGGLGERRLFRVILKHLGDSLDEPSLINLIYLIPEYGRFDDLFVLLQTKYSENIIDIIKTRLNNDLESMKKEENVSLLAKWLPSINASSEKTKKSGRFIADKLHMSEKEYRKILSSLRKYIDVVECKMSDNLFEQIKYEAVPSKANIIYKNAFMRRDEERRLFYLESLKKGETKINAGVLFPHDIVSAYTEYSSTKNYDETLEQLWKSLPKMMLPDENTIVVADGSGSMMTPVSNSKCSALSVANALAIYFAENSKGQFNNKYITFSCNPQLVDLSKCNSLREKLKVASAYNEVANTDIYKVFKLILVTALKSKTKQNEIPKNIVIISDMEFDQCANNSSQILFVKIQEEYEKYGYKLPRLIFWNLNSRTNTIPVKENDLGVALVSGFSINIAKMVMSNELDPYKCLLDILNADRYQLVKIAINISMLKSGSES